MKNAEEFFRKCVTDKESCSMVTAVFIRLRHFVFHSEDFEIEKLSCTTENMRLHIKRPFLQTHKCINSAIIESISQFPLNYGYEFEEDKGLVIPQIVRQ